MYVGYLNDRKELGFSHIENPNAIKELSDFVTWIRRKGKQIVILIFSKETLVGILIILVYQERLISDPEFNSFEDNDQKVILVKTGDSAPSASTSPGRGQPSPFPTPPAGGKPSRPIYMYQNTVQRLE